jgi:hypothetical protein
LTWYYRNINTAYTSLLSLPGRDIVGMLSAIDLWVEREQRQTTARRGDRRKRACGGPQFEIMTFHNDIDKRHVCDGSRAIVHHPDLQL